MYREPRRKASGQPSAVASLLAEIAQTVDEIVIIDRGRRIASGRLDELTGGGKTLEDTYLELTTAREGP
jgi:ABC-2 type transport system ATP-binding protein